MRLSIAQARALNIDEDIIRRAQEHAAFAERSEAIRERLEVEPPRPKRAKPADGFDSKLERDFAEVLKRAEREQWIRRWWHHPCGFRLAPKCYFHPDMLVEPARYQHYDPASGFRSGDNRLTFVEVKGGWFRDDAKVKTKVAAEMFPCFRWLIVYREKQHDWDIREVDHRGIGMSPIHVPWICNL